MFPLTVKLAGILLICGVMFSGASGQSSDEEAALIPYYNNYLREYHLGPEDVISVEVFGEPKYSKAAIVIPPTARISYPLIAGGIFVGGKTTEQLAEDIRKRLDEYIIDPRVTVTLDKVGSARFGVMGKVNAPGLKPMSRRYNIHEAIAEAGGFAKEADTKRVLLLRMTSKGEFSQTIINYGELTKGKGEVPYLLPGDQLIIPEKKWSLNKVIDAVGRVAGMRVLFGAPY
jgi:polysaccharide biosynthesis/export protein